MWTGTDVNRSPHIFLISPLCVKLGVGSGSAPSDLDRHRSGSASIRWRSTTLLATWKVGSGINDAVQRHCQEHLTPDFR
jgi:hypothetical protein